MRKNEGSGVYRGRKRGVQKLGGREEEKKKNHHEAIREKTKEKKPWKPRIERYKNFPAKGKRKKCEN